MCLCKVYNIDTSEFVGINAYDKVQEQGNLKAGIFFPRVRPILLKGSVLCVRNKSSKTRS